MERGVEADTGELAILLAGVFLALPLVDVGLFVTLPSDFFLLPSADSQFFSGVLFSLSCGADFTRQGDLMGPSGTSMERRLEGGLSTQPLLRSARFRHLVSIWSSFSTEHSSMSSLVFFLPGSSSVTQLQRVKHSCSAFSPLVSRRLFALLSEVGGTLESEAVGYCSMGVNAFRGDGVLRAGVSDLGVRVTQFLMVTLEADSCLGDGVEVSAFCLLGVCSLDSSM